MRHMRTTQQAAAWVKEQDASTALTQTAIRRLVLSGEVPHVKAGTKRLIALEDLEAYLAGAHSPVNQAEHIRPVEVRS